MELPPVLRPKALKGYWVKAEGTGTPPELPRKEADGLPSGPRQSQR